MNSRSRGKMHLETLTDDTAALNEHLNLFADYKRKHESLRKTGVIYVHRYSLEGAHRCAVCDKVLKPHDIIRTDSKGTYMHRDVQVCAGVSPELFSSKSSPIAQAQYMAASGHGVKKAEQILTPPQGFAPPPRPERIPSWQDGVCTVTPSGQVVLPDQQPVALLPAHVLTPLHVPVAKDTPPLCEQIQTDWLRNHGLLVPVTHSPHSWEDVALVGTTNGASSEALFRVVARPQNPGSDVIFYDVRDCRDRIIQSSPRRDIARRVADMHNKHFSQPLS